jgi:hypothetical protein
LAKGFFESKKCGIAYLILVDGEALQKREQFCVKLRKEKKALILREKRAKICTLDQSGETLVSDETDSSDYNYSSYSRFRNEPGLLKDILDECLPQHMFHKVGSVSKLHP